MERRRTRRGESVVSAMTTSSAWRRATRSAARPAAATSAAPSPGTSATRSPGSAPAGQASSADSKRWIPWLVQQNLTSKKNFLILLIYGRGINFHLSPIKHMYLEFLPLNHHGQCTHFDEHGTAQNFGIVHFVHKDIETNGHGHTP